MNDHLINKYQESELIEQLQEGHFHPALRPEVTVFLPFTIKNLEAILQKKYGQIDVTQNEWLKKNCGINDYTISIDAAGKETSEQIKAYIHGFFQEDPIGGSRNYRNKDLPITLFLQYKNENGTFNIHFNNISAPDLTEIVQEIYKP